MHPTCCTKRSCPWKVRNPIQFTTFFALEKDQVIEWIFQSIKQKESTNQLVLVFLEMMSYNVEHLPLNWRKYIMDEFIPNCCVKSGFNLQAPLSIIEMFEKIPVSTEKHGALYRAVRFVSLATSLYILLSKDTTDVFTTINNDHLKELMNQVTSIALPNGLL